MEISGNEIADVVLRQFDAFPTKGKPLNRGAGVKEWVPLSGIVAQGWLDPGEGCGGIARLTPST
jgi:tRNA-specific adenosine deaminase 1